MNNKSISEEEKFNESAARFEKAAHNLTNDLQQKQGSKSFGGIEINSGVRPSENASYDVPNLDRQRSDRGYAQRSIDRRAEQMKTEEEIRVSTAKTQNALDEFGRKYQKKRKVIKRVKVIITVAIIATAIAAGIAVVKEWSKVSENFSQVMQQTDSTTQEEMTLDDLKANLEAGYTEIQINGHWYSTSDAIESKEQGIPLDSSKSLDVKASENVEENKIR